MAQLLLLHLLAAVVAPVLVRLFHRKAFLVLALVPATAFGWLVSVSTEVRDGRGPTQQFSWVPGLGLDLDFRVTTLSWVLGLLVTGVGALVLLYCTWYFKPDDDTLCRFAGGAHRLRRCDARPRPADDLLVLYVFWELTTVFSYLLIGHNPASSTNRRAAMQALIVTTFGGLAMLVGIIAHRRCDRHVLASPSSSPPHRRWTAILIAAIVLLLVGALSKSALIPFHFWLPGAMAAPTPVSAYLHAAAMVKAGVYLVALLAPAFAASPGLARRSRSGSGSPTMLLGGWRALRQHDLKLLLAYGTVSQLGFLVAGDRRRDARRRTCRARAHRRARAVQVHAVPRRSASSTTSTGTRDLRRLSGVGRRLPVPEHRRPRWRRSRWPACRRWPASSRRRARSVPCSAVSRTRPHSAAPCGWLALAGVVLGSMLTVAYTARFLWGAFASKPDVPPTRASRCRIAGFVAAPLVLGAGVAAGGPDGTDRVARFLMPYADLFTIAGCPGAPRPVAWPDAPPSCCPSLSIVAGVLLFLARDEVARAQARLPDLVDGERIFGHVLRGVDRVRSRGDRGDATRLAPALPHVHPRRVRRAARRRAVLGGTSARVRLWDSPAQVVVGAIVIVRRAPRPRLAQRLTGVMLVGVTGYGTAMLFIFARCPRPGTHPDARRDRRPGRLRARAPQAARRTSLDQPTVAGPVLASRPRPSPSDSGSPAWRSWPRAPATPLPTSEGFPGEAYAFGHGKNIVNVTLVDIRAWDTLGEISVLVVAATGVASLIFVSTRNARLSRATAKIPALRPSRAGAPGCTGAHAAARASLGHLRGRDPARLPRHAHRRRSSCSSPATTSRAAVSPGAGRRVSRS